MYFWWVFSAEMHFLRPSSSCTAWYWRWARAAGLRRGRSSFVVVVVNLGGCRTACERWAGQLRRGAKHVDWASRWSRAVERSLVSCSSRLLLTAVLVFTGINHRWICYADWRPDRCCSLINPFTERNVYKVPLFSGRCSTAAELTELLVFLVELWLIWLQYKYN